MNAITNYIFEANLGLIFFSAVYFLLLHRETQFKVKRAYLLGAMLASVVFPLIEFQFLDYCSLDLRFCCRALVDSLPGTAW